MSGCEGLAVADPFLTIEIHALQKSELFVQALAADSVWRREYTVTWLRTPLGQCAIRTKNT